MITRVLVTGDVIVDHHVYEGQQRRASSLMRIGTHHKQTGGGAQLLVDLLTEYHQQFPQAEQAWKTEQLKRLAEAEEAAQKKNKSLSPEEKNKYLPGVPFRDLEPECGVAKTSPNDLLDFLHLNGGGLYGLFAADPMLNEPCPCEAPSKKSRIWRLKEALGYGAPDPGNRFTPTPITEVLVRSHNVWLIDDAGLDFRERRSHDAWPPALRAEVGPTPEWIILKTAAPLASGDLWRTLATGRFLDHPIKCDSLLDRMVVVVSADDVRCESARISRGVSWERTALDLVKAVRETPALGQLARCRYLIVTFGAEGAALVDGRKPDDPSVHLIFDSVNQEGDWTGRVAGDVFGKLSCFVAALISRLPEKRGQTAPPEAQRCEQIDLEVAHLIDGIRTGLRAVRCLLLSGHGREREVPRLPLKEVASEILQRESSARFQHVVAPKNVAPGLSQSRLVATAQGGPTSTAPGAAASRVWRILEGDPNRQFGRTGLTLGHARLVAQFGLKKLTGVPCLSLGALKTVDRGEIESLRNIKRLIEDYRDNAKVKRPLSIGVFGQPGSGKSFGVKQIAKAVLHDAPILEFNLSQLSERDELVLIGAFHQIRDKVLEGKIPVVFWDEFDARNLYWLAKLLAPMQDGTFLDGQTVHPVGKCVFVFAGGTSYDFVSFGPPTPSSLELAKLSEDERERLADEQLSFRKQKGPDFKSRLTAYLNVAGPNQRKIRNWVEDRYDPDLTDTGYPLRRALLLRAQLRVKDDKRMDIDSGLLTALLEISEYRHGARSIEKVIEQLNARGGGRRLMPSHVPPDEILDLHVDAAEFRGLLERDYEFCGAAQDIAPYIHAAFLKHVKKTDATFHDNVRKEYNQLRAEYQDVNIAAARRMADVLAVAGLMLEPTANGEVTADEVRQHIDEHVDVLADAEHTGWMEQKLQDGWEYAPDRDDELKRHDCLLTFAQLPTNQQDKDRNQVRQYPEFAHNAGYQVVFRKQP